MRKTKSNIVVAFYFHSKHIVEFVENSLAISLIYNISKPRWQISKVVNVDCGGSKLFLLKYLRICLKKKEAIKVMLSNIPVWSFIVVVGLFFSEYTKQVVSI